MNNNQSQLKIQIYERNISGVLYSEIRIYELGALVPQYIFQRISNCDEQNTKEYFFIQNLSGDWIPIDSTEFKGVKRDAKNVIDSILVANPVTLRDTNSSFYYLNNLCREIVTTAETFPQLAESNELEFILKTSKEAMEAIFRTINGESIFSNRYQPLDM